MQERRKGTAILPVMVWMLVAWAAGMSQNVQSAALPSGSAQTAAPSTEQAQIEKGRQAVGQVCAACHGNIARMIQVQKKNGDQWRDTIFSMIGRGAHVMPDEIEALTAYLIANAGRQSSTASGAQAAGSNVESQTPQAAQGRALLERNCQQCHDLETATRKSSTRDSTTVVRNMVSYGANLTVAEQETLATYLNSLPPAR